MKRIQVHNTKWVDRILIQTLAFIVLFLMPFCFSAQVQSSVDSTSIKIGQEIKFKIEVQADTTDLVVFPEGQTFVPLEMIESYTIDTTKNDSKYRLIKQFGLTQFDSGTYTIPRQKVSIGTKVFYTDSLRVEVNNIEVDTTKQGLYDIKPFIEVEKSKSKLWLIILCILLAIALVAFLLYWFIWRKKPLSEEAKIALLPPYDRAKLALKILDESTYLENAELKDYYSELTFIIRKYLDEKVYDRALESTTDELISRLNLLNDANQIELSKQDIVNLETILKRADLVKFAKSAPDVELAKLDRNTIDVEIDHVKAALPEPTEEEKLLNQQYREAQERKKKRNKIIITVLISVFLIVATFIGFGIKYGFAYVKDTLIGHESKELLEGDWVRSEYGIPPIMISTPKVLERLDTPIPDDLQEKVEITAFGYGSVLDFFSISVSTTKIASAENEEPIDVKQAPEAAIKQLEAKGIKDIAVIREEFTTPNGATGLKTFGTARFPMLTSDNFIDGHYLVIHFVTEEEDVLQQIMMTWQDDDVYAEQTAERILNSVELKQAEE